METPKRVIIARSLIAGAVAWVGSLLGAVEYVASNQWAGARELLGMMLWTLAFGLVVSITAIALHPTLKEYFASKDRLEAKLGGLDGVWVSGGNVFVLRQAMKLSGFDSIACRFGEKASFVYGGYSAGCCVLSKTLKPYQMASDPTAGAYKAIDRVLWDGLGLIDFAFMPHYK
jgi:hypothetical protein